MFYGIPSVASIMFDIGYLQDVDVVKDAVRVAVDPPHVLQGMPPENPSDFLMRCNGEPS
jgi:hypothetical protein